MCYGFVDYLSSHHAALAIQTYHGYETEGKRLRVAYASSGGRRYAPGQRPSPVDLNSVLSDANDNIIGWELIVSNLPDMMETEIMVSVFDMRQYVLAPIFSFWKCFVGEIFTTE